MSKNQLREFLRARAQFRDQQALSQVKSLASPGAEQADIYEINWDDYYDQVLVTAEVQTDIIVSNYDWAIQTAAAHIDQVSTSTQTDSVQVSASGVVLATAGS